MTKPTQTQEQPVVGGFDAWLKEIYYKRDVTKPETWRTLSVTDKMELAYTQGHTAGLADQVVVKDLVFKKEQGFYVAGLAITTTYKIEQKAGLWHLEINGFSFIGKKTKAEQIQNANAHHKAAVLSQIKE